MTDIKKLPFDLEKALAGHPLVTRDGQIATDFTECNPNLTYQYLARVNGIIRYFTKNGKWDIREDSPYDLFLLDTSNNQTMENNKELTLIEKFNAGWEFKSNDGSVITEMHQFKNGRIAVLWSNGNTGYWQSNEMLEYLTITPPVERRWVNVWATEDGIISLTTYQTKHDSDDMAKMRGSFICTDQFTIIKTENGWKLEK